MVETRWDLVVQALMRALVIEHVANPIEAALLGTKRNRRLDIWLLMPLNSNHCPPQGARNGCFRSTMARMSRYTHGATPFGGGFGGSCRGI